MPLLLVPVFAGTCTGTGTACGVMDAVWASGGGGCGVSDTCSPQPTSEAYRQRR